MTGLFNRKFIVTAQIDVIIQLPIFVMNNRFRPVWPYVVLNGDDFNLMRVLFLP